MDQTMIIILLAEEFKGQLECFGENTKVYNFFSSNRKRTRKW